MAETKFSKTKAILATICTSNRIGMKRTSFRMEEVPDATRGAYALASTNDEYMTGNNPGMRREIRHTHLARDVYGMLDSATRERRGMRCAEGEGRVEGGESLSMSSHDGHG